VRRASVENITTLFISFILILVVAGFVLYFTKVNLENKKRHNVICVVGEEVKRNDVIHLNSFNSPFIDRCQYLIIVKENITLHDIPKSRDVLIFTKNISNDVLKEFCFNYSIVENVTVFDGFARVGNKLIVNPFYNQSFAVEFLHNDVCNNVSEEAEGLCISENGNFTETIENNEVRATKFPFNFYFFFLGRKYYVTKDFLFHSFYLRLPVAFNFTANVSCSYYYSTPLLGLKNDTLIIPSLSIEKERKIVFFYLDENLLNEVIENLKS